jgi:hypothetical protein
MIDKTVTQQPHQGNCVVHKNRMPTSEYLTEKETTYGT